MEVKIKNILLIGLTLTSVYNKVHGQWIETNIPLPPQASARDLIYNPNSNKIYTANVPDVGMPSQKSVTIIDGNSNSIITTVQVPEGPRDFCHNTQNNKIYVANYFADSITVIDGQSNQIIAVLPAGDGPRALCYNSTNNSIYCANEFSGNVTVIDGTSNSVVATIQVGSTPRVICYNNISNKIYVPNAGSQNLSVISGSTNTVVATLPMGNVPRGIVFNPQNNRVYVSNYGSDNVRVVDGVTDAVVATIPVGDGPTAMFHNPSGNKIYCSNVGAPGPNTPAACTISVIDAGTNSVIKTITAGDEPTAFAYSNSNKKVYWVDEWSHRVSVADAAADTIIRTISLGSGLVQPVDLCYNPVNERIYTANRLTFNITVIKDSLSASPTLPFTFTGNGNWDDPDNWLNKSIPPAILPAGQKIIIDPIQGGQCVLNIAQRISSGAQISVNPAKIFLVQGNLTMQTSNAPTKEQMDAAEQYSISKGGQTFIVVHQGQIIRESYANGGSADRVQLLASGTKGFTGMIGAIAAFDGIINLDTPVAEVLTEWQNDVQKSKITYRHLLTMTSGLEELKDQTSWTDFLGAKVLYPTGTVFIYGPDPNIFGLALQRKLGAEKVEDYMNRRLFQPLGIRVEWRGRFPDGNPQLSGGAYVRANEWYKFGEFVRLMLADQWNGPQILSRQFLQEVITSSAVYPAYGFYWWLKEPVPTSVANIVDQLNNNQFTQQIKPILDEPSIPEDFIMCRGAYGQCLYVIPSRELVVVRNAPSTATELYNDNEFLKLLLNNGNPGTPRDTIPYQEGLTTNFITVNGTSRKYLMYRPTGISKANAVVMVLHGGGGLGLGVADIGAHPLSVFRQVADTAKFMLVYPEGSPDIQGNPGWNDCRSDDIAGSKGNDMDFLMQLNAKLAGELGINSSKMFLTGTSNGALMTLSFAFVQPQSVRAIAISAGNLPLNPEPGTCTSGSTLPLPILITYGTSDPAMPAEGGCVANIGGACNRGRVVSQQATINYWLQRNNLTGVVPQVTTFDINTNDAGNVEKRVYAGNHPFILYMMNNAGHAVPSRSVFSATTPNSGAQNRDIEYAVEVWQFFRGLL